MKIDSFISELGQAPLSLFVYNLNEDLVFKTHENDLALIDTQRKAPTIVTLDGITGFLSIQPIYSKGTRERIGYAQTFYELTSFYEIRIRVLRADFQTGFDEIKMLISWIMQTLMELNFSPFSFCSPLFKMLYREVTAGILHI
jgi:hypothetical protein